VLTPEPTYSREERDVVYRALAYVAAELTAAGVPVVIDATAHRRAWRDLARERIPRFAEVQVLCPLEICQERERARRTGNAPPAIYARAGRAGTTVPGVDVAYEPAESPELTVDSVTEPTDVSVSRIVALARQLSAGDPPLTTTAEGWVVWITGLPGSGKTTIASAVAAAMRAHGVPVRVLDVAGVRRFTGVAGSDASLEADIVHRTLAYTAKLLAEAGLPVIVDATAPRRQWRRIARDLVGQFAEVQLVCPREVCGERERAARWTPWCGRPLTATAPDIVLDYEPSLHPELVVDTGAHISATAVEEVFLFVRSLERRR
jgi:adenylylsulfate kinase